MRWRGISSSLGAATAGRLPRKFFDTITGGFSGRLDALRRRQRGAVWSQGGCLVAVRMWLLAVRDGGGEAAETAGDDKGAA